MLSVDFLESDLESTVFNTTLVGNNHDIKTNIGISSMFYIFNVSTSSKEMNRNGIILNTSSFFLENNTLHRSDNKESSSSQIFHWNPQIPTAEQQSSVKFVSQVVHPTK